VKRSAAIFTLVTLLSLALIGCGGEESATETVTVVAGGSDTSEDASGQASDVEANGALPDLVGERLDVAESTLDDLGIAYEEIGGGTFGVVDASNWTVCAQDPGPGAAATSVELVVARPGECDSSTQGGGGGGGGSADSLPDLAGVRLDIAEDQLEDLGIAYEIIGGGTFGVLDHTAWEVCETQPGAGAAAQVVKLIVERPGEC
jgi:PASTA domain